MLSAAVIRGIVCCFQFCCYHHARLLPCTVYVHGNKRFQFYNILERLHSILFRIYFYRFTTCL